MGGPGSASAATAPPFLPSAPPPIGGAAGRSLGGEWLLVPPAGATPLATLGAAPGRPPARPPPIRPCGPPVALPGPGPTQRSQQDPQNHATHPPTASRVLRTGG